MLRATVGPMTWATLVLALFCLLAAALLPSAGGALAFGATSHHANVCAYHDVTLTVWPACFLSSGVGSEVVCQPGGKCRLCQCSRTRVFDQCNPGAAISWIHNETWMVWGSCSADCEDEMGRARGMDKTL